MKYIKIVFLSVFIIIFSNCKDIIFNNPLDPNGEKGVLIIIKILNTNSMGEGDLAFDGEKIWRTAENGRLIAFDRETGERIREIPSAYASGIAFSGNYLYLASETNYLTMINPLSGDIVQNFLTGELYFKFIANSESRIIGYDTKSSYFFTFEPETGEFEKLFRLTGFSMGGISLYKGNIILTEKNSSSIFLFDLSGNVLSVYSAPANEISGITVDENFYVYILSSDGKIYKVSLP